MPNVSNRIVASTIYNLNSDTISVTAWAEIEGDKRVAIQFEMRSDDSFVHSVAPKIKFSKVYVNVVSLLRTSPVALMAKIITALDEATTEDTEIPLHVHAVTVEL